jgi:hypothetical protein
VKNVPLWVLWFISGIVLSSSVFAAGGGQNSNPIMRENTLLLQWDYLRKLGAVDRYLTINVQPTLPFHLNDTLDLVAYSDLPINAEAKVVYTSAAGLNIGDYQQYFYFSRPNSGNTYFGIGPILSFPTATDPELTSGKWGLGPALMTFYLDEKISYGINGYYLFSFAGNPNKPDLHRTYWNPYVSFKIDRLSDWGMQIEPYYDFVAGYGQLPLELYYEHLVTLHNLNTKITINGLYWLFAPSYFPSWSARFCLTLIWPKK